MCGLVGFSGESSYNINSLKFLLYYNSIERKSTDATGIWSPKTGLIKSTEDADKFLTNTPILDTLFLGHVRATTSGGNSKEAAHPHVVDNIIGIHNGTLKNENDMLRARKLDVDFHKSDSYKLFQTINHDLSPRPFKELEGAAAVIFTDMKLAKDSNTLYVYRNNERPLFRGKRKEGMYICSEEHALSIIGCTDIHDFKAGYFYKITDGKIDEHYKLSKISVNTEEDYDDPYEDLINRTVVLAEPVKLRKNRVLKSGATVKVLAESTTQNRGADKRNFDIMSFGSKLLQTTVLQKYIDVVKYDYTLFENKLFRANKNIYNTEGNKLFAKENDLLVLNFIHKTQDKYNIKNLSSLDALNTMISFNVQDSTLSFLKPISMDDELDIANDLAKAIPDTFKHHPKDMKRYSDHIIKAYTDNYDFDYKLGEDVQCIKAKPKIRDSKRLFGSGQNKFNEAIVSDLGAIREYTAKALDKLHLAVKEITPAAKLLEMSDNVKVEVESELETIIEKIEKYESSSQKEEG